MLPLLPSPPGLLLLGVTRLVLELVMIVHGARRPRLAWRLGADLSSETLTCQHEMHTHKANGTYERHRTRESKREWGKGTHADRR